MNERLEQLLANESIRLVAGLAEELGVAAWLAGGGVRDCLLEREVNDLDFALGGAPVELPGLFAQQWGGTFFWLDVERLQARVVKKTVDGSLVRDFAPLRGENIEDDLRMRDFTVNALAMSVAGAGVQLIDPLGGEVDIRNRLVRACSDHAFDDDPLRLLRALRFAAELSFILEEETWNALGRRGKLLGGVAAERTRDELFRILAAPGIGESLARLVESGLLRHIFPPELGRLSMGRSSGYDRRDLDRRIGDAAAVERCCGESGRHLPGSEAALAGYLATEVESGFSFLTFMKLAAFLGGVDRSGVALLTARLRLGRKAGRLLEILCGSVPNARGLPVPEAGGRALFRFFRDRELAGPGVVILALATEKIASPLAAVLLNYFAREYDATADDLLLSGDEIMALAGIGPGKRVGEALEALREAERCGRVSDREDARRFVKNLLTKEAPVS